MELQKYVILSVAKDLFTYIKILHYVQNDSDKEMEKVLWILSQ